MGANLKYLCFCILMAACALRPFFSSTSSHKVNNNQVNGQNWAFAHWHQNPGQLIRLPLTVVEQRFASGFPGAIARFTDGNKVWVVRHVNETTRMLHSAADCFRGLGYSVSEPKVVEKVNKTHWRCFLAERGAKLQVCERIFDTENKQWTDVSAWYWENLFQSGQQNWWAITEVSRADIVNS